MEPANPTLWIYLAVAIGLVLLGGAFAGLTIALMGQVRNLLVHKFGAGKGLTRHNRTRSTCKSSRHLESRMREDMLGKFWACYNGGNIGFW